MKITQFNVEIRLFIPVLRRNQINIWLHTVCSILWINRVRVTFCTCTMHKMLNVTSASKIAMNYFWINYQKWKAVQLKWWNNDVSRRTCKVVIFFNFPKLFLKLFVHEVFFVYLPTSEACYSGKFCQIYISFIV